ncbi:hypothetical protein LEMLEM_LOCUS1644, partial [Lemmus lemmus]
MVQTAVSFLRVGAGNGAWVLLLPTRIQRPSSLLKSRTLFFLVLEAGKPQSKAL